MWNGEWHGGRDSGLAFTHVFSATQPYLYNCPTRSSYFDLSTGPLEKEQSLTYDGLAYTPRETFPSFGWQGF
jgi:hypothetical protein